MAAHLQMKFLKILPLYLGLVINQVKIWQHSIEITKFYFELNVVLKIPISKGLCGHFYCCHNNNKKDELPYSYSTWLFTQGLCGHFYCCHHNNKKDELPQHLAVYIPLPLLTKFSSIFVHQCEMAALVFNINRCKK